MGRARLTVKFIEREQCRKASFSKRTDGLKKKLYEFSTLCGVDSAMILYNSESENVQPLIWPENPTEVQRIIKKFQAKIIEQRPKTYDVKAFLHDRQNKVDAEIMRMQKRLRELLYPSWRDSFENLDRDSLIKFIGALDSKLEGCNQRMTNLRQIDNPKGKTPAAEYDATGSHFPHMLNVHQHQLSLALPIFPLLDNINNNQLPYYPSTQFDVGSSSYMSNVDPNQLPRTNEMADHCDGLPPPSYYNGMQFHNNNSYPAAAPQDIPSQNIIYEEAASLQVRPPPQMQGFRLDNLYNVPLAETPNFSNMC